MLTYAFGDIHGCAGLLRLALQAVTRHARGQTYQLVFLGDYVDRGPDSRTVIELLMTLRNEGRVVCLLGNHERMLLDLARTPSRQAGLSWIADGGSETLGSYELDPSDPTGASALPVAHLNWLRVRPIIYPTLSHVFVHAGIDPSTELTRQGEREYLWIRTRFLKTAAHGFVERRHIVHGHTPLWDGKPRAEAPELLAHRTNLDTGAYVTGTMVVGVFDWRTARPVDVLTIQGRPRSPVTSPAVHSS